MRFLSLALCAAALAAGDALPPTTTPPTPPTPPVTQPAARPYLGITIDKAATALDGKGLAIMRVEPSSPAAVMGLQAGDRLLSIDGTVLKTQDELAALLSSHKPGDKVNVEFLRAVGENNLPQTIKAAGVLQEAKGQTKTESLGRQLQEMQGRFDDLSKKYKEPTLAEVLQKLQDIEKDLPIAAEQFKKIYPNGEFRIVISLEITSDKDAKDPLNIEVGPKKSGKDEAKPDVPKSATRPEATPK